MNNMNNKKFKLEEVYGLGEKPLNECPTFVTRDIHNQFKYCIESEESHIIVYGASRQGKTWMVERYCPEFIRIGCDIRFTRNQIFKSILSELGIKVGEVTNEKGKKIETKLKVQVKGGLRFLLLQRVKLELQGMSTQQIIVKKGYHT